MKILKNIKEKEIVGLLFLLLTFIYFFMSKRLKIMYIYYDEMFYYQLPQNILFGNGMKIYNIPQDFQKLIYSFVLMPSFLFKNKILQINIIAFINSILMASGIIPLYLISKELILKKINIILCLLIYCFYSDFMFTYTFMSENLFIPLSYWAIYFLFIFYNKKAISNRQKKLELFFY